jgi:acyl carrier protein phosphodiesterase
MNYLAHLYLAEQNREGLLGSLLGDFVKGPLNDRFPETVRRGIALHRAIDSFTDAHPLHLESRNRISRERRRYAGIIIDVCYDHFLCRSWTDYSNESLTCFAARVYDVLREHQDDLPDRLRRIAPHMIADDWLGSYSALENVGRALDGIARRIARSNPLAERFFPELEAQARRILSALVRR